MLLASLSQMPKGLLRGIVSLAYPPTRLSISFMAMAFHTDADSRFFLLRADFRQSQGLSDVSAIVH